MSDEDCAECPDVQPGTACPVCERPMPALVHDVEETHTPAPIWDTDPQGVVHDDYRAAETATETVRAQSARTPAPVWDTDPRGEA